ncbi:MAG: TonB-dependent receptor, partial [Calditrichaeota bacterium]
MYFAKFSNDSILLQRLGFKVQRKLCTSVVFFCALLAAAALQAGITGTLSGKVFDKETGQVLPGAAIVVEGTTMGTMADKDGFYMIHNLPAGSYNVSASMIGYAKQTIQQVQINVDMNKVLNFYLSTEVLPLKEVVVTNQRELIQSDLTSSTYFVSGDEINKTLPIDSYRDAVALLPGVVGDHIRGSREGGVVYMLDGLPIQSGLSREISSYFPNSSIVEMMVQTGGFSAEYGQATSGIINVVTKDGGNKATGGFKFYTDFFDTGLTGNDNTRRLELNVGGPITVGFGGPLLHAQYFVAADLNLSDTSFRKQMRQAFDAPVFSNYNLNSKLSFDISTNTRLTFQGLVSNWRWRKFDSQWELNLSGLAEQKHFSHRFSVSLAHTFSPKLFASIRIADYANKKEVLGSTDPSDLLFEDPSDPTSRILEGTQPWREHTKERIDVVKFDLVGQLSDHHLLKTGLDFQNYKLNSDKINFTALPSLGNTRSLILSKNADNFDYTPQFFALYIQDNLRVKGISANLGIRYDIFSPQIVLPEPPQEFQELRTRLRAPLTVTSGQTQAPISPRLGVSIPLSDNERLHVNYGWYYQMPPLYYLYANAGRSLDSYFPFVGSVDLKPIKTISTEFSYRRIVAHDLLFVLTGFTKQFENLVDTQVFALPD